MSCCCSDDFGIRGHFDPAIAARDLRYYKRNGPNKTTVFMRDALIGQGIAAATVLDIGAGVGALSFELLAHGARSTTGIDLSAAYAAVAGAEAAARRVAAEFEVGDFVERAADIPPADVVVLDRVVCCYPHAEPILRAAAGRSRKLLALSYPRNRWYMRAAIAFENAHRRFKGEAFRSFVHDTQMIERLIETAGFRRVARSDTLTWRADTFLRVAAPLAV
jgi:magnesium-protoporphyrin O-methyltransferase